MEAGEATQTATPIGRETAIAESPKGDAAAPLSALQDGYAGYDHDFFGQGPSGRLTPRVPFRFLLKQRVGEVVPVCEQNH